MGKEEPQYGKGRRGMKKKTGEISAQAADCDPVNPWEWNVTH